MLSLGRWARVMCQVPQSVIASVQLEIEFEISGDARTNSHCMGIPLDSDRESNAKITAEVGFCGSQPFLRIGLAFAKNCALAAVADFSLRHVSCDWFGPEISSTATPSVLEDMRVCVHAARS